MRRGRKAEHHTHTWQVVDRTRCLQVNFQVSKTDEGWREFTSVVLPSDPTAEGGRFLLFPPVTTLLLLQAVTWTAGGGAREERGDVSWSSCEERDEGRRLRTGTLRGHSFHLSTLLVIARKRNTSDHHISDSTESCTSTRDLYL